MHPFLILAVSGMSASKLYGVLVILSAIGLNSYPPAEAKILKFQGHRSIGSAEAFFKFFTIYGHDGHLGHVIQII